VRNNIGWLALAALVLAGCGGKTAGTAAPTIGVAFETLQTGYRVASHDAIATELKKRNLSMLEAIADGDANRQFEQIRNFITRRVDAIIVVPKDAQTVVPTIREANRAGIPIVLFNRPPAKSDLHSVTVVADNFSIDRDTVAHLAEEALKTPGKRQAAILIGDLGDINAIARRDGFEQALKPYASRIEIVSRIPTEWNQEKALAGITNALQAHLGITLPRPGNTRPPTEIVAALEVLHARSTHETHDSRYQWPCDPLRNVGSMLAKAGRLFEGVRDLEDAEVLVSAANYL
jgi:ABC-type sugar transport system substrate-binding protein